jgi:class 3 adenylate cyclase
MGADATTDPKFEIGHVLFIDIVGYSKLLIGEQSEVVRELKEVVATSEQVRVAEEQGRLVSLPTGDGVALVFRDSAETPAHCALEIAHAVKKYPKLRLRMGIIAAQSIWLLTSTIERMLPERESTWRNE